MLLSLSDDKTLITYSPTPLKKKLIESDRLTSVFAGTKPDAHVVQSALTAVYGKYRFGNSLFREFACHLLTSVCECMKNVLR